MVKLKPSLNKKRGYYYISLQGGGKRKNFQLHRLVADYFIENKFNKPQVNHIDGNKSNNNASNLEWCTRSENHLHAFRIGLREKPKGNRKYPDSIIKRIKRLRSKGLLYREISSELSIPISTVTHVILGTRRA